MTTNSKNQKSTINWKIFDFRNERDKKTNQIKLIKLVKLEAQNKLTNVVIPPYKE